MKSIFKYIAFIVVACCFFTTYSCSDDDNIISNEIGSTMEHFKEKRISTFYIPRNNINISDTISSIIVSLENTSDLSQKDLFATTAISKEHLKVKMEIPNNDKITDGTYNLSCILISREEIIIRFIVQIKNEMIHIFNAEIPRYKFLDGDGTAQNPYIISSTEDFDYLLYNLSEVDTELHGKGSYFSQTADFEVPKAGIDADGREYASFPFAGNYNGNMHTISKINYTGTTSNTIDINIGLFDALLDGTQISNLNLEIALKDIYSHCGALAGYTTGNVSLESISASGIINNCSSCCGGLLGKSSGNLSISNCSLDIDIINSGEKAGGIIGQSEGEITIKNTTIGGDISGTSHIGGVIGYSDNSSCKISSISNSDSHFSTSGASCIGGIIGTFNGNSFNIEDITLTHTVTQADDEIKTITGTSECTGGIIGKISTNTVQSYLKNITIKCPVRGKDYVGGLIGYAQLAHGSQLSIDNCLIASIVKGSGNFVGGLLGSVHSDIIFTNTSSVKPVDGYAEISGGNYTGGIFGYSNECIHTISSGASLYCNVNISGYENVGGFAGYLGQDNSNENTPTKNIDISKFSINNNVIITGKSNVGGLVGQLNKTILSGQNNFNYDEGNGIVIPKYSRFTPNFTAQIRTFDTEASTCFGGAVGKSTNSIIRYISVNSDLNLNNIEYAGGIVGYTESTSKNSDVILEDCTYKGTLKGDKNVGGIAGIKTKDGQVRDCINYGTISGRENTGGVIGKLHYAGINNGGDHIYYCVNTGPVTGSGADTGGVVGYMQGDNDLNIYVAISHCGNYGKITGSATGIGGILGQCSTRRGRILNCANHGHIYTENSCRIGGIAGSMGHDGDTAESTNLQVGYCANRGTVESTNGDSRIGGILGYQEEGRIDYDDHDSWLHDCYNTGTITCSSEATGGIVGLGDNYSYIQMTYNCGKVNNGNGGAIIGDRLSGVTTIYDDNNYYLSESGKDAGSWIKETSISTNEAKTQSTFEEFNFSSTWKMDSNHPILQNCPFQKVSYSE